MKKLWLTGAFILVAYTSFAIRVEVGYNNNPKLPLSGETLTGDVYLSSTTANPSAYALMPRQEVEMNKTDRLIVKSYAAKRSTGGGGSPVITNWYGDGKQRYFSLPLEATEVMRTDGSNSAATFTFNGFADFTAIATPTLSRGRVFRSTVDNHLYYSSDGSTWTKLDN